MTKRRAKNAKPTGANKSLGNALHNRAENRYSKTAKTANPNIVNDDRDSSLKVLASVTHENEYQEFFNNAELAGRDFAATRTNDFKLMESTSADVVNVEDIQSKSYHCLIEKFGRFLRVPRRPAKETYSNAKELEVAENAMFIEWKRGLAQLAEGDGVVLTPFERNPELWRQLWRVLERSDIMVQIVDSRNPLLFRSVDLEKYASEFDPPKKCVLLVNKADLLSKQQIDLWQKYFDEQNISVIFWSATALPKLPVVEEDMENDEVTDELKRTSLSEPEEELSYVNDPNELLGLLKGFAASARPGASSVVVGMVGYPNVGKSSTINKIIGAKKTSVSSTPGKTKHFQTLIVDDELTLCDCPGLVMPSFGFSSSEMLLNGILSADQMLEFYTPVQLLCNRVGRNVFESMYSVMLPKPAEFEDPNRPATAHELLTAMAFIRGFMSASGIPDCSRAARIVIKDVFNGKLKWVAAPPGFDQEEFDKLTSTKLAEKDMINSGKSLLAQLEKRNYLIGAQSKGLRLDNSFFGDTGSAAHIQPVRGVATNTKNHFKKRDKLRRMYRDLDA